MKELTEEQLRDNYRKETQKDIYADECCLQPTSSFSDDYVKWLELILLKARKESKE